MQYVTPDIGMAFQVVDDELRDTFLSDLFQGPHLRSPEVRSPVCR